MSLDLSKVGLMSAFSLSVYLHLIKVFLQRYININISTNVVKFDIFISFDLLLYLFKRRFRASIYSLLDIK